MNELVHIAASPHPFRAATADFKIEEGYTIAELLNIVQPNEILRKYAYIEIDGVPVPYIYWNHARPRAGHIVSIGVMPQGGGGEGGKNPLRTLLTVAVIVASIYTGGALAAAGYGLLTQAAASAAITIAGGLLINAIAPIRPPSVGGAAAGRGQNAIESPSYFIDQARNAFRPYAPVPVIFGKHRVVPPLGAQPVTELVGNNQYLHMIIVWGHGPLRVTDIRIGDTPISSFKDVKIETLQGRSSDAPLTLYSNDIDQQSLSINLTYASSWQTRRSALRADELSVDIVLPRGLAKFNEEGKRKTKRVSIEVQYRRVGASTWLSATNTLTESTFPTTWITGASTGRIQFVGARSQPIRYGLRWSVAARNQYDIRIRRVSTDDSGDRDFSNTLWSTLRTINNTPPVNFNVPLAMSAISIRATDQLSGSVDTISGLVESEALIWDGNAWVTSYTNNPASMYRLALQHPGRRFPANNANVDLSILEDFYDFCVANGYTFNHILDVRQGIWDILSDICAVARASPTKIDDKYSVIIDTGTQLISQHFTPINSDEFSFQRSFIPAPDGLRVLFADEDEEYIRNERIVYADGKNDINAITVPDISPVGITNRNHVYKFARFQIAQSILRRETWTLKVSFEYLVARRGSKVTVQHDSIAVGVASARVIQVTSNAQNNVVAIKVDAPIDLPKNVPYSVKLRTVRNTHIISAIDERDGEYQTFTFSAPLSTVIEIGALISVGESGYITVDGLITSIEPEDELTAKLTILIYQEGVYNAETGRIPSFVSGISPSYKELPNLIIIASYADAGTARLIGDVYQPGIYIAIQPISHSGAIVEAEIRPNGTEEPYRSVEPRARSNDSIELGNVEVGISYDIRLRWNANDREPGNWTTHSALVISTNAPPPAPTNFVITEGLGKIRGFGWIPSNIPDYAGARIKYSATQSDRWDNMSILHNGILTSSPHETETPNSSGTYYFEIRAVDTAGTESISGTRIVATLGTVEAGADGQPGPRGLTGYAQSIIRPTRASSVTNLNSTRWHLSGGADWPGNKTFSITVNTEEEALLRLISIRALITLYRDINNWGDYTLSSLVSFSGSGAARVARLSLTFIESRGSIPSSGSIALHFTPGGVKGNPGIQGDDASRGPGLFSIAVSSSQQALLQSATNLTTLTTTSLVNLADGVTPGNNLVGDIIRFYRTGFVKLYGWGGASWRVLTDFIGAEVVVGLQAVFNTLTVNLANVTGKLTANHIDARSLSVNLANVTGVLTADHISSDVRNWTRLAVISNTSISEGDTKTVTLSDIITKYDFIVIPAAFVDGTQTHTPLYSIRVRNMPARSGYLYNDSVDGIFLIAKRNSSSSRSVKLSIFQGGTNTSAISIYSIWGVKLP